LRLVPQGERIRISAKPRLASYARAHFHVGAEITSDRQELEETLKEFVEHTIHHFAGSGTSPLEETWALVKETSSDELEFCQLMGALGLSPYEEHTNVERALDLAAKYISKRQLLDLCLTSDHTNVVKSTAVATFLSKAFASASEIDLSPLRSTKHPDDDMRSPPHRIGYDAAKRLREGFSIVEQDISGASAVFQRLHINPESTQPELTGFDSPVIGSTSKHGDVGKAVLTRETGRRGRFAAARALYFLWTEKRTEKRLITNALTRDQQISRAFAAELLVPQSYIRSFAKNGSLKREKAFEIADLAGISLDLVEKQAINSRLAITS
jgi:hypothetical protein